MALDSLLIEILVDPIDHGPLYYFDERGLLYNPRTKTAFEVVESIPVLLPNEGRAVGSDEAAELEGALGGAVATGSGRT